MNHGPTCQCKICAAFRYTKADAALTENENMLRKYGWVVHFVMKDLTSPMRCNIHTHGLAENFGHLDLQIVFPLRPATAHALIANLVDKIKEGQRFTNGDVVDEVLGNGYRVKLVMAHEGDRPVLRMIIPGKDGKLDHGDIELFYRRQYADLTDSQTLPDLRIADTM